MDGSGRISNKGEKKNYRHSRLNAVKHGVLSENAVLPWENRAEYDQLLRECKDEYHPEGPVETHYVEEIVGTIWRKRRLQRAEQAAYMRGFQRVIEQFGKTSKTALSFVAPYSDGLGSSAIVTATEEQKTITLNKLNEEQRCASEAINILRKGGAFDCAFAQLSKRQQKEWEASRQQQKDSNDQESSGHIQDAIALLVLLYHLSCGYRDEKYQIKYQSEIQEQVFGESVDIEALDGLARQQGSP
jgi:hypothetical protein